MYAAITKENKATGIYNSKMQMAKLHAVGEAVALNKESNEKHITAAYNFVTGKSVARMRNTNKALEVIAAYLKKNTPMVGKDTGLSDAAANLTNTVKKQTKKDATPKAPKERKVSEAVVATRPKEGTKTGDVWDICDTMPQASRADVITACVAAGLNVATARTQYQRWFSAQS